jgi:hypothetical protein
MPKLREFNVAELVTHAYLEVARRGLETSVGALRHDTEDSMGNLRQHVDTSLATMRRDFRAAMDNMGLTLTIRLGTMIAVGFGALAPLLKL